MKNQKTTPVDILAFSPHPDDVELGCGGSLILAADSGLRVAVVDMTAGEMSSQGTPPQRASEAEIAARLLGASARISLGLPDTKIGAEPEHRSAVIQLIREIRPSLVLAPYREDRHPDHRAAGALIREACFYAGVAKMGEGVPHRPQQLFFYMIHSPFDPTFIIDVSPVWERRMAAVWAYQSQFQPATEGSATAISQPAFLRALEARAIWFGSLIGAAYGEPFFSQGALPQKEFPGLGNPSKSGLLPPYRAIG